MESGQFFCEVLDALSAHVAVVSGDGTIQYVNRAWLNFWEQNSQGTGSRVAGIGSNYFKVCESATGPCSEEASMVLRGMRDVLEGRVPIFEMEYPCHAPNEFRWFVLRVTSMPGSRSLVVSHSNSTERRRVLLDQAQATHEEGLDRSIERELSSMRQLSGATSPVTSGLLGLRPLKDAAPKTFEILVERYAACLGSSLDSRLFQSTGDQTRTLRGLAEELEALRSGPRDVTDIHLEALRLVVAQSAPERARALAEEGRLVVLQLMGYLAQQYRGYAFAYTRQEK